MILLINIFFCCKPFVKYFEIYFQSKCITMDGDELGSSLVIICGPHQSTIEMYHTMAQLKLELEQELDLQA